MVECAGLEIRYTVLLYRGFESLSLRQQAKKDGPSRPVLLFYPSIYPSSVLVRYGTECAYLKTSAMRLVGVSGEEVVIQPMGERCSGWGDDHHTVAARVLAASLCGL